MAVDDRRRRESILGHRPGDRSHRAAAVGSLRVRGRRGRRCWSVYYLVTLFQVWRAGNDGRGRRRSTRSSCSGAAQYDGAPSPQLAARLDHALDLWERGRRAARDGHRRQAAGRPLHRGGGRRPATWSSAACPEAAILQRGRRPHHLRVARRSRPTCSPPRASTRCCS